MLSKGSVVSANGQKYFRQPVEEEVLMKMDLL